MNTITQELLARSYGDVTHADVKAAGGKLIEKRGNYAFYDMEDGSRIAVPYVPFDRATNSPFILSIEPTGKPSYLHGFHLGTDERVAREIAAEMFHARNAVGKFTCTVALIRDRQLIAVYDGDWSDKRPIYGYG